MLTRCFAASKAVRPALSAASRAQPQCLRAFATSQPTPKGSRSPKIMLEDENAFGFIRHNKRPPKPRKVGVTEIRGPYYSVMGKRYLEDVLDT